MALSKKQLAILLSRMQSFEVPDVRYEQYPTDSELAAEILWTAHMAGELESKRVADLGCGTGILGIGALALDASHVTFLEIDPRTFPALMANLALLEQALDKEFGNYEIIQGDVSQFDRDADLVIQNPPFGTRTPGVDVQFLNVAMRVAPVVYSLHKTSTEEHLKRIVTQAGRKMVAITRHEFPLKNTMAQHEKRIERIEVSCLKIVR